MNMQIDLEKGIANVGDVSRMKEVMARAKRGERLVIGFIGGSITQGSLSSTSTTLLPMMDTPCQRRGAERAHNSLGTATPCLNGWETTAP